MPQINRTALSTKILALVLVFAGLHSGLAQISQQSEDHSRISVLVQIHGRRPTYRVNGKIAIDPLRALESLWTKESKDAVVEIMIDPHATFLQLGEIEGIVGKAGFQHVNSFVYSPESGLREAVRIGAPELVT